MFLCPLLPGVNACAADPYDTQATANIQNLYAQYLADEGLLSASSPDSLDPYHVYILDSAGVSVANWSYNDTTLKSRLIDLTDQTMASETVDPVNAKHVAYQYLAVGALDEENLADDLLQILINRHEHNEDGTFYKDDWSQWTNLPVFDVLTKTNTLDRVDAEPSVDYLLGLQQADGSFGDFMSTTQAVRTLHELKEYSVNENLAEALSESRDWLQTKVQEDGSYNIPGEDPVTNTAEIIKTLHRIGADYADWEHPGTGQGPADYLATVDFSGKNAGANAWALAAYLLLGAEPDTEVAAGDSQTSGTEKVNIRIEAPQYTILPETSVPIVGGTGYAQILIDQAEALGYTVQYTESDSGLFVDSINDIPGEEYWMVTPWQGEGYYDGDYFVLYGGGSTNEGEIQLSTNKAAPRQTIKAVVQANGQPLKGATLIYYTEANRQNPNIAGVTDAAGKLEFDISTAGTYRVAAAKTNTASWPDPDNGLVRTVPATLTVSSSSGGGTDGGTTVALTVNGKYNEVLFQGNVTLRESDPYGITPRGALVKTALPVEGTNFVTSIDGQANAGMEGWMFRVNGVSPQVSAVDYRLAAGDKLVWFYSGAAENSVGALEENTSAVEDEKKQSEVSTAITKLKEMSGSTTKPGAWPLEVDPVTSLVIGLDNPLSAAEKENLANLLQEPAESWTHLVETGQEGTLTGRTGKLTLNISRESLTKNTEISLREKPFNVDVRPSTHRPLSALFQLGPTGLHFSEPVYISIRAVIPEDISPAEVVLARYHADKEAWFALPTVVDVSSGTLTARVDHFSEFAVLARERPAANFADVSAADYPWAAQEISYLATKGIVNGVGANNFHPGKKLSRAEMTAMLVRALPDSDEVETIPVFTDVQQQSWYADYVQRAAAAGLVRGMCPDIFAPEQEVTREQLAVIVARILPEDEAKKDLSFKDRAQTSPWALEAVSQAVSTEVLRGFPDDTFRPRETVSRAEMAVLLYRILWP